MVNCAFFKKGVVTRHSRSNPKNIYSKLQCAKDRLIVPSQCFQNKLVFLSLWIRVLLFPLHLVLMHTATWFHCSLKHGESNFLRKTDTRKPNFVLSNCWKPLVPDVLHLAISSSVNSTSTQARGVVDMSVPVATIAVTLVHCSSVGLWLLDTNGVTFWSTGCRGGLDGAIWGGNTGDRFSLLIWRNILRAGCWGSLGSAVSWEVWTVGLLQKPTRDATASESNVGNSGSSSNNGKAAGFGSCWWRHLSAVNSLTTSVRFNICCRSSVVTS